MHPNQNTRAELLIGLAGPTGAGKSTIAKLICRMFPDISVVISYDAYYRDLSGLSAKERDMVDFDRLEALEAELLVAHLRALRQGYAIEIPRYDFVQHIRLQEGTMLNPQRIVLIEGIFVLAEPHIRAELDLSIYIDASEQCRLARRLERDVNERGWTQAQVDSMWVNQVRPAELTMIEPSRQHADLVLTNTDSLQSTTTRLHHVLSNHTSMPIPILAQHSVSKTHHISY